MDCNQLAFRWCAYYVPYLVSQIQYPLLPIQYAFAILASYSVSLLLSFKHDYPGTYAMSHYWVVLCVAMVIVTINNCNGQRNYDSDNGNNDDTKLRISLPVSNQHHQIYKETSL
jgi:hypothetical protein